MHTHISFIVTKQLIFVIACTISCCLFHWLYLYCFCTFKSYMKKNLQDQFSIIVMFNSSRFTLVSDMLKELQSNFIVLYFGNMHNAHSSLITCNTGFWNAHSCLILMCKCRTCCWHAHSWLASDMPMLDWLLSCIFVTGCWHAHAMSNLTCGTVMTGMHMHDLLLTCDRMHDLLLTCKFTTWCWHAHAIYVIHNLRSPQPLHSYRVHNLHTCTESATFTHL